MKLQTPTPINTLFRRHPNRLWVKSRSMTRLSLPLSLSDGVNGIELKKWRQIVTTCNKISLHDIAQDMDKTALMEFTIQFKLFLLGQLREIMDVEPGHLQSLMEDDRCREDRLSLLYI